MSTYKVIKGDKRLYLVEVASLWSSMQTAVNSPDVIHADMELTKMNITIPWDLSISLESGRQLAVYSKENSDSAVLTSTIPVSGRLKLFSHGLQPRGGSAHGDSPLGLRASLFSTRLATPQVLLLSGMAMLPEDRRKSAGVSSHIHRRAKHYFKSRGKSRRRTMLSELSLKRQRAGRIGGKVCLRSMTPEARIARAKLASKASAVSRGTARMARLMAGVTVFRVDCHGIGRAWIGGRWEPVRTEELAALAARPTLPQKPVEN